MNYHHSEVGSRSTEVPGKNDRRELLQRDVSPQAGNGRIPLPKNEELYMRLYSIKQTLEWVYPSLIKTIARKHAER